MEPATSIDLSEGREKPVLPRPPITRSNPPDSVYLPAPWKAHLHSLIGQPVTVVTFGGFGERSLLEFHGKLLAIDFHQMSCAIETSADVVLTFRSVHHIVSFKPKPPEAAS